jgi:hypothetical protein
MCLKCDDTILAGEFKHKHVDGIWVVIDPQVDIPGYIPEGIYTVTQAIEVGD